MLGAIHVFVLVEQPDQLTTVSIKQGSYMQPLHRGAPAPPLLGAFEFKAQAPSKLENHSHHRAGAFLANAARVRIACHILRLLCWPSRRRRRVEVVCRHC